MPLRSRGRSKVAVSSQLTVKKWKRNLHTAEKETQREGWREKQQQKSHGAKYRKWELTCSAPSTNPLIMCLFPCSSWKQKEDRRWQDCERKTKKQSSTVRPQANISRCWQVKWGAQRGGLASVLFLQARWGMTLQDAKSLLEFQWLKLGSVSPTQILLAHLS